MAKAFQGLSSEFYCNPVLKVVMGCLPLFLKWEYRVVEDCTKTQISWLGFKMKIVSQLVGCCQISGQLLHLLLSIRFLCQRFSWFSNDQSTSEKVNANDADHYLSQVLIGKLHLRSRICEFQLPADLAWVWFSSALLGQWTALTA